MNTLKAGKMKDSGSPFREMTPEEREYFEGMLADVHLQFIEAVAAGRKLTVECEFIRGYMSKHPEDSDLLA